MKTARFSQVVEQAGKPEIYLLFSPDDPAFARALKTDRIMTVVEHGSSPAYGSVGYDRGHHGQLLLFPKSLKRFADARIIGIKFDLFAESQEAPVKKAAKQPKRTRVEKPKEKTEPKPEQASEPKKPAKKREPEKRPSARQPSARKVIAFPRQKASPEEARVEKLKADARRALEALAAGQPKEAARHLLHLLKSS